MTRGVVPRKVKPGMIGCCDHHADALGHCFGEEADLRCTNKRNGQRCPVNWYDHQSSPAACDYLCQEWYVDAGGNRMRCQRRYEHDVHGPSQGRSRRSAGR